MTQDLGETPVGLQPVDISPKPPVETSQNSRPERFKHESMYHAALIKRWGREVTPQEFQDIAQRIWGITDGVFHGVRAELNKDEFERGGTMHDNGYVEKGEPIDLTTLTPEQLKTLMKESGSLVLDLKPAVEDPRIQSGWVKLKWEREQGSKVFVYGQSHDATQPIGANKSYLTDALYAEAFPDGKGPKGYVVKQGIKDTIDEDRRRSEESKSADLWSVVTKRLRKS